MILKTSIAPEIQQLKLLRHLNLSYNQIQTLPTEISTLEHLLDIGITGNPLTFPPLDVVFSGITSILAFLKAGDFHSLKYSSSNSLSEHLRTNSSYNVVLTVVNSPPSNTQLQTGRHTEATNLSPTLPPARSPSSSRVNQLPIDQLPPSPPQVTTRNMNVLPETIFSRPQTSQLRRTPSNSNNNPSTNTRNGIQFSSTTSNRNSPTKKVSPTPKPRSTAKLAPLSILLRIS